MTAAANAPTGTPEPKASWRQAVRGNVLAMGLVSLFTDFSSEMMNPLLPVFIAGLVGTGPEAVATAALVVGVMEGLAETVSALLKIFSGRLSDRLGKRKPLVIIGYGLSALARPAMALAGGLAQVVVLKCADRVGKGLRTSPRDALIGDSVGKEFRGLAFSFHRSMDHLGAVLGPLVAVGILYLLLGKVIWEGGDVIPMREEMRALRWLFAIAIIPGVLAMLTLFFMVGDIAPKRSAPEGDADGKPESVWRLLPGRFYAFVGVVTLFALGNSSDMFIVLLAKAKFGLGLVYLIALWVGLHIAKICFSIPGGVLSDRIGRRPVIVLGWTVYALVYFGFAFSNSLWHFWLLLLAYGAYYGLTEGAEKALVADFVPSRFRGTAFGIYHSAIGLAMLPASLVFGLIWKWYGAAAAFGIGAALAALAAVLLIVLLSVGGRALPAHD